MTYDPRYQRPGEDLDEWEDRLIYEANRSGNMVYAMDLLQFAYLLPGKRIPALEKKAARDSDCFAWICDYWDYVKWNEHGNECNFYDAGGYGGFLDQILDTDAMNDTIEYLLPEGRIPGYERAVELADGLIALHERYAPAKSRNRRGRPSKPKTKAVTKKKPAAKAKRKVR